MSVYCHSFENGFSNLVIPTPTTNTLFATAGPPYAGLAQMVEESGRERNNGGGAKSLPLRWEFSSAADVSEPAFSMA
jgi:hypothetical protein